MNVKIQNRHCEIRPPLERLINRQSEKVRKILPTFADHDLSLHINLEKLPRGKQYHTVLVLRMPQHSIRVEQLESSAVTSVHRAFEELLRRVHRFKSQLSRERFWQRQPRQASSARSGRPELEKAMERNLEKVEKYLLREIYHRTLLNHFPPGILQPQALVDEIFLEATAAADSRPERVPLEQWIFQIARRRLRERIASLEASRQEEHLETAADGFNRWDDETLNFYQPDEVLRLEDLIRDEQTPTPEEILEQEEAREEMQKEVARLPENLRESFVLFALEGFNSDEVAMITGRPAQQVLREVDEARAELRRKLGRFVS